MLAFPNRTFHGVVSQVRKNPVVTSNVVTYTTVVLVDNNDQALLPGMTANATIDVQKAANALRRSAQRPLVHAGLHRYAQARRRCDGQRAAKPGNAAPPSCNATAPRRGAAPRAPRRRAIVAGSQGRVFVQRNGKLVRVPVSITLVSGTQAAVAPAGDATLAAGDQVVTGGGADAKPAARAQRPAGNPLTGGAAPGGATRGIH